MAKTMKDLAAEAVLVQNACNPLGLSNSFRQVVLDLRDALAAEGKHGHDAICRHPVFRLWASKFHDMAGMGLSDLDRYSEAYRECERLAAS